MIKSTLIEMSEEDLNVSKLLFEHGQFPHSIFYLQQSIEKLVKHLGLSNNIISPDKLRNEIGHKTEKIFKALVYKTLEFSGETKGSIDDDYNKIIEFNKTVPLKELLPTIKINIEKNKTYVLPEDFKEKISSFAVFIQSKEINNLDFKIDEELLERKVEEYKKVLPPYHSSVMALFIISNFFKDYVSCVRYPSQGDF